jgi:hypothetical protein
MSRAIFTGRRRAALWVLIAGAVLLVAGANAHLVYVATTSQPDCVRHARAGDAGSGQFAAAQSACTSR